MIGSARANPASFWGAVLMGLLALVVFVFAGCGSGDEATTASSEPGTGVATVDGGGGSGKGPRPDQVAEGSNEGARPEVHGNGHGRRQATDSPSSQGPDQNGGGHPERREKVKRKLKESCPPDADAASCEALVEGFLATRGKSNGHAVEKPSDCTRSMSKEQCEATLKAQKASEGTYSVAVEECLANPTPRCEEVLRPLFEQQRAAESSGG